MFPAIREAWREFRAGLQGGLTTLDLKSGFGFNTTSSLDSAKRSRLRMASGGFGPAWSGETVSEQTALNHSVVWSATRVISEVEAMLPLPLMERRADGRFPLTNHSLYKVLHDEPNEQMSAMELRETLTAQCVLRGNAYARIIRRPGTGEVIGLYPTHATPDKTKAGELVYVVKDGNGQEETFTVRPNVPHEVFHLRGLGFDGVKGQSVIAVARQSIGTALSAEKFAAKFYAAGGRVPYVLEWDKRFKSDQDYDKFRSDWRSVYGSGSDSFHEAPILEPGMTYKAIGLNPEDSQFLETRQFGVAEICRWFLMSPHMVGDLSRATFSNIEHLFLEFLTRTEMAWLVRWEQAIHRCLLTPREKERGIYAKHNINAMLRGDFKSRMEGYSIALQNGKNSVDEVRALEDENPLPNNAGKSHYIQLNMQTVPGTGDPTAAEMAALAKVNQERK